jgi:hypothetical protein
MGLITMIRKILDSTLSRCCGVDLRALALFRVGLAIILLVDLFIRAQDIFVFYSDSGVLPRVALIEKIAPPWSVSLLLANGQPWFVIVYFAVTALVALCVLFGVRTKISLLAMWILTIGLYDRNPATNQAGEALFMAIQFWALFLPIERVWSVDAAVANSDTPDDLDRRNFASLGTFCYLVQLTFVYVMSGLLKTGDAWRDGTAVFYALSLESWVSGFGVWIRGFSSFGYVATYATIVLELAAPVFFFIPWRRDLFRFMICGLLCLMHIGFTASLHISIFGLTDIVALLPLLPGAAFTRLRHWLIDTSAEHATILVEPGNTVVLGRAKIARELIFPDSISISAGTRGSEKVAACASSSMGWRMRDVHGTLHEYPESLSALMQLSKITRLFRSIMGTRLSAALITGACRGLSILAPSTISATQPSIWNGNWNRLRTCILVYALIFVAVVNIESTKVGKMPIPSWAMFPGRLLHLSQKWSMFHSPPKSNNWIIVAGVLDDGTPVNVLSGAHGPVDFSRPRSGDFSEASLRWRRYHEWLRKKDEGLEYRRFFGRYLCRRWNGKQQVKSQRLKTFNFVLVSEPTLLTGGHGSQTRRTLNGHICYKQQ